MFAKDLIQCFPNDKAVLSTFTDFHWAFKTKGPFESKQHYYIGCDKYSIENPLNVEVIEKGIKYLNSHNGTGYNSMENHSIQISIANLNRLKELCKKNCSE